MKKVIDKICEYEKKGISDIKMIALVSDTSFEVIFYGVIDGVQYQSNNMVEEGKVESDDVDAFYEEIASIVRGDAKFDSTKMNIIKADSKKCTVDYDEKKCKTYKIIRAWEKGTIRQMRRTLSKYVGRRIEFKGIVAGRPKNHEKTGRVFDKNINDYPKYRENVILSGTEPFNGPISPIEFPELATCITNVEGINGFEDIKEDHVNLQEDIMKLWHLNEGDEVRLSAVVAEYLKGKGKDCCLVDIERLHS